MTYILKPSINQAKVGLFSANESIEARWFNGKFALLL